ncbi:hypothetical protein JQN58_31605 [Aneurinibacillus sp. BA2021]|nr:hypothetical protein [Aneurinibacillus sp. BA2021]
MSKHLRLGGAMLVAAATLAAATGCVSDTPAAEQTPTGSVEKNISAWTLPLDPYVLTDKMLKKAAYAGALVIAECLEEKGTPLPVPYVDFDSAYEGRETTRSALTEEVASTYGYHLPQEALPLEVLPWEAYRTADLDAATAAVSDECSAELQGRIPGYSSDMMNFSSMFVGSAFEGTLADPAVREAADRWNECMVPLGVEDLPALPIDMPSDSVRQRFTTSPLSGDDPSTGDITREEVRLALEDVDCRESSGFQQAFYDALWEREAASYEQNAEAFESLRAKVATVSAEIDATIAELATAE